MIEVLFCLSVCILVEVDIDRVSRFGGCFFFLVWDLVIFWEYGYFYFFVILGLFNLYIGIVGLVLG